MALINRGPFTWDLQYDDDGNREYHISHLIQCTAGEGPMAALAAPGLPVRGSIWAYSTEVDQWAFCSSKIGVKPWNHQEGKDAKILYYRVDNTFKTKSSTQRCQDTEIDDPLLEPPRVSGSFLHFQKEATKDRYGNILRSSSFEQFTGKQVEFDESRPAIRIEINYLTLDLSILCSYIDTVNSSPMWGLPARCIKLSDAPWERKLYGSCCYYYTISYDFQINVTLDESNNLISGFDRQIVDSGTKALHGELDQTGTWSLLPLKDGSTPDPLNPSHYKLFEDLSGNHTRVFLNGAGIPVTDIDDAYVYTIQKYPESNFFLLGIPTTF